MRFCVNTQPYQRISLFLSMAILLVLAAPRVWSQAAAGNIVGVVTDPSAAAVGGARVTLTNVDTHVAKVTQTDRTGAYRFDNVLVGNYQLTIEAKGFTRRQVKGLVVELNRTLTANARLALGEVTTTIDVTESQPMIDTTTSQLASTYDSKAAMQLNMASNVSGFNNLGAINLSLLSAGVASSGGVGYGIGPSVGGQRPTNNNFVIDGIDNNRRDVTGPIATISNEATGEFTLIQNMMSPEFGNNSGGTFNVVPKSGTNELHGSIYEYFQNRDLNALDASYKRQGISDRQRLDQNRLGATAGGPIIKNKLFYFGNFEYIPYGQAGTPESAVFAPTAAGVAMIDQMPGINQTNWSIFKQYVPTAPTASASTTVGGTSIPTGILPIVAPFYINSYNYLGNVDYNLSEKDQLRFRLVGNNQRSIDNTATLPAFFSNSPVNSYVTSFSEIHTFSPTMFNEGRLAYTRYFSDFPVGNFQFPGLSQFPNLAFTNDLNLQIGPDPNAPQSSAINTYTFNDNVTKVLGRHTLKFGYDLRRVVAPQFFVQRVRGDYEYTTLDRYLFDQVPDDIGERSFGASAFWGNLWSHAFYANDDFRLKPNLTVNLGLRYEYVGVPAGNQTQSLNSIASVPGVIDFRAPTAQTNNWAPRVGLAWSPRGSGSLSIRAGFGMAYDQVYQNLGILSLPPQFFTTSDVDLSSNATGFLANGGLTAPPQLGTQLSAADARALTASYVPDQKRPYAINWTLGVEKVFAHDYTLEVRYLGTRGVNLPAQMRLNAASVVTPGNSLPTYMSAPSQAALDSLPLTLNMLTAQAAAQRNTFAQYGFDQFITAFMPIGNSTYHGLATQIRKRFSRNLQFLGSYTWSHNIDDGTAAVFSTLIQPRRPQDFQNYAAERASSALDRRQRFTMSWVYETPWFAKSTNWLLRDFLANYTFSGTYIAESPMLATVQSGIDANLNGDSAGDRVIINPAGTDGTGSAVTPLKNSAGATVAYLATNPNARYISAGLGAYANGGRSTLPLRGINNFDLSFSKRIYVSEHKSIEFRTEMYNAFNHSQFTPGLIDNAYLQSRTDTRNYLLPSNVDFNNPEIAFGNNPRTIQMALRFQF
ncbi:MAG: TonB-dependent receptor [Bryobacterales bacterium]|nr:TonB-dependent receptor [Bryobacterales bacterium]